MVVIGVERARCAFENEYGDPPVEFAQFRIDVTVLEPAQTVVGQRRRVTSIRVAACPG